MKDQKPCLVETGQGFSVVYQEKFLYSKYNPSKNICQKISSMDFLPGTIILALSPVLEHGLKELAESLPENCIVLLCEAVLITVLFGFRIGKCIIFRLFSRKHHTPLSPEIKLILQGFFAV